MNKQSIVIVKYNAGNIQSVLYAMERIGAEAIVTDNPELIRAAGKVIFPGVGAASSAMRYLRERGLDQLLMSLEQPVLGICLGMQLMCNHSEEGNTQCLGIFDHAVKKFDHGMVEGGQQLKIPQVGWNQVLATSAGDEMNAAKATTGTGLLFQGIPQSSNFYFVHSYYAGEGPQTAAVTGYGIGFSSALQKKNFHGVQFHPEKSAGAGEQLLRNFING